MATKVRKQFHIRPDQEATLKRLTKKTGMTEAEIIRQAIDRQIRVLRFPQRELSAWEKERAFITKLIKKGPVPGERTWRRVFLYGR